MRARDLPFVLAFLLSLFVLFTPGDDVPSAPGVDKLVHAGLFALLAGTGALARVRPPVLAGALLGYAVTSELIQAWAPLDRSGDVLDTAADALGISLGLAGAWLWRRRSSPASR